MAWDDIDETPLCVTLEEKITVPGPYQETGTTDVFRARERSIGDEFTTFLGLNIGPENTYVQVRNENIRAVAHLGPITDGRDTE